MRAKIVIVLQMVDAVKAAEKDLGPIDVVVSNAGVASGGKPRRYQQMLYERSVCV